MLNDFKKINFKFSALFKKQLFKIKFSFYNKMQSDIKSYERTLKRMNQYDNNSKDPIERVKGRIEATCLKTEMNYSTLTLNRVKNNILTQLLLYLDFLLQLVIK